MSDDGAKMQPPRTGGNAIDDLRAGHVDTTRILEHVATLTAELAAARAERDAHLGTIEHHRTQMRDALFPDGDGPTRPALCDLVAYVAGDMAKLRKVVAAGDAMRDDSEIIGRPDGDDVISERCDETRIKSLRAYDAARKDV